LKGALRDGRFIDKTPVAKVSFVSKAGDLGCGVGYYK
jgi:hypothetical protein